LNDGSIRQNQIDDVSNEFPRFDERLAGRKHRYGYFVGGPNQSLDTDQPFQALLKRDYQTGKLEMHSLGDNFMPESRCSCRAAKVWRRRWMAACGLV